MVVAVDQIFDGMVKALLDLRLEPFGRTGIDGVGDQHAPGGHIKDGKVKIVLKAIDVTGYLGDAPLRRFLRHGCTSRHDQ